MPWRLRLLVALGAVAVLAGIALAMLPSLASSMLYPAPPVRVPSPPPAPLQELLLPLATGEQAVAWTSAREAPAGAPVALFFHGNGENLETMRQAGAFENLAALGVAFLAVDYPGYGGSTGRPTEPGLFATGDAALAWAAAQHPGRRVVAVGWSLGAAVAISLAARHPEEVDGLIALSPWTSLAAVAHLHFPAPLVKLMLRERYDSLAAAPAVRVAALVVHGESDELIPIEQGRQLAAALPAGTRWVEVPGAGHNDLLARPEVWREMGEYLAGLRAAP